MSPAPPIPPITPQGPLHTTALLWQQTDGAWSLTINARATFALTQDGEAVLCEATDDAESRGKGKDATGSRMLAECAHIPLKRGTDVIITGDAIAPRGQATAHLEVGFSIGTLSKTLEVSGPRLWRAAGRNIQPSAAKPFRRLPLRYEDAARSEKNPAGIRLQRIIGTQLPAIQLPADDADGTPGFGPIPSPWRASRLGLSEAQRRWAEQSEELRGPAPEGFRFEYFNCAPPDQQLSSLEAAPSISLENLHPTHASFRSRLPALQATLLARLGSSNKTRSLLMQRDTIWIDANRSTATIFWRAVLPADSMKYKELVVSLDNQLAPSTNRTQEHTMPGKKVRETAEQPAIPASERTHAAVPVPAPRRPQETRISSPAPSHSALPFNADRKRSLSPPPMRAAPPEIAASAAAGQTAPPMSQPGRPAPAAAAASSAEARRHSSRPPRRSAHPAARADGRDTMELPPGALLPGTATPPTADEAPLAKPAAVGSATHDPRLPAKPVDSKAPVASKFFPMDTAAPAPPAQLATPQKAPPSDPAPRSAVPPAMIGPLAPLLAKDAEKASAAKSAPSKGDTAEDGEPSELDALLAQYTPKSAKLEIELPLETYAALRANLDAAPEEEAELLEQHELPKDQLDANAKHWADAIEDELGKGKQDLQKRHDKAYVESLEERRGPITVVQFARIEVATERGNVEPTMAALEIPASAQQPIARAWLHRTISDLTLGKELREAIRAVRGG